jgi:hypothetical protein
MTPIHPSQTGRCRQKRTVLLVGEGPAEWAFLKHVIGCFCDRAGPVAAKAENAHGGSPETVVSTARKLLCQRAYDRCLVLMDTDLPWPPRLPIKVGQTRMSYVGSSPCLEGLLLRVLRHPRITTQASVDQCKRVFHDNYVPWEHRTEPQAYARCLPRDLLLQRRVDSRELDTILKHIEGFAG